MNLEYQEWDCDILAALTPEEMKVFNEQLNYLDQQKMIGILPTYVMTDPDGNIVGKVPDLRFLEDATW